MNAVTLTLGLAVLMTIGSVIMAYKLRKINNAREQQAKSKT